MTDLINRLRTESLDSTKCSMSIMDLCMEAAAALEGLMKDCAALARESVRRETALAKLEAEVKYWADAQEAGRLFIYPDLPQDADDITEPLKIQSALRSELLKLELRKRECPEKISILDYTIIKVLHNALAGEGKE